MPPTVRSQHVWQSEGGNDFLQLKDQSGRIIAYVDAGATASGFAPAPPTKHLYVDGSRTDFYMPNGSNIRPFRTIMDAVNQVIANGDNATNRYMICIAAAIYDETLVLENSALFDLVFWGYRAAKVLRGIQSQANNQNLSAIFVGLVLGYNGLNSSLNLTPASNQQFSFYFCDMSVVTCNFSGAGQTQIYDSGCTLTAWNQNGGTTFVIRTTVSTGGVAALTSGASFNVDRASRHQNDVTVDATSTFNLGTGCRQQGNVTVSGLFANRLGLVTGSITVNAGGQYQEICGGHTGSFTNAGTYSQQGTWGSSVVVIGGAAYSAGNVVPNGSIVGNPGDIYVSRLGGAGVTFWVKESGVGTNTGWVGK